MTSNTSRLGILLALVFALAGCDLDPEPDITTIEAETGQSVFLQGQRVPASEVYWLFAEHPAGSLVGFTSLTGETATFVPRGVGEYIVDRWVVSGPAGVWTDRYVVNVK